MSEKNIRNYQKTSQDYQQTLTETRAHLSRCIEILNWIYASRSWRISNSLRQIEQLKDRRSAGSRADQMFQGQLETPQVDSEYLEIRGWVRSTAGPIRFVEAFLDDFYLGSIRYGQEQPDWYGDRISLHGFDLAGIRTLRIRAYDEKDNKRVYSCPVLIPPPSHAETNAVDAPPQIFQTTLESPTPEAVLPEVFEITGWAFSGAGAVTFVQAFLDDVELGRVNYGLERGDVVRAFPQVAPLRCGFNAVFSLTDLSVRGKHTLKVKLYDEKGNTLELERPVTITNASVPAGDGKAQSAASKTNGDFKLPRQLEQVIAEFQNRSGRDPSILDWDSRLDLAGSLTRLAVFSPPPDEDGDSLPYFDRTVDIVVTSGSAPAQIAEARRVAAGAFVRVVDKDMLEVEWKNDFTDNRLQTTSIVIPVYNKVAYTQRCLDTVIKTLPPNSSGEIIVVDDASTDNTPEVLKQFAAVDSRLRVFRNEKNSGFIASCNRGAQEASGEILIFLNNDTVPADGWLQALLRVFHEKPEAGAVGGKLIYPDGTLQEAGGVIFSDGSGCNFGKYDKAANAPLYSFLREVDYCSGALLATPRALFLQLGGFDTRYEPAYYEDTDYCFTLRANGYRVYYQPESVIVHFEGISSGTDITTGVKSYQAVNRNKFVEKWKDVLRHQPAPPKRLDAVTLQELAFSRSAANGHGT